MIDLKWWCKCHVEFVTRLLYYCHCSSNECFWTSLHHYLIRLKTLRQ